MEALEARYPGTRQQWQVHRHRWTINKDGLVPGKEESVGDDLRTDKTGIPEKYRFRMAGKRNFDAGVKILRLLPAALARLR